MVTRVSRNAVFWRWKNKGTSERHDAGGHFDASFQGTIARSSLLMNRAKIDFVHCIGHADLSVIVKIDQLIR